MIPHDMTSLLVYSEGQYRYWLKRTQLQKVPAKKLLFVMLNPSTAGAVENDPTIRRCINFAKEFGATEMGVVNLFAMRSTEPAALYAQGAQPVGTYSDDAIRAAVTWADEIILAFGAPPSSKSAAGLWEDRARDVADLIGDRARCLALTKGLWPGHPLYLPRDAQPFPWTAPNEF